MTSKDIYELPPTATVYYFDVETDQNLTSEEYQQLKPQTNGISINKSGSNFTSEKALNGVYGPGNDEFANKFRDGWGIGLAAITYLCPPFGAIASGATAASGAITGITGKIIGNDDMAEFGWDMTVVGATAGLGVAAGSQGHKSSSCKISSICPK